MLHNDYDIDYFQRAPFNSIEPKIIDEIKKRLYFDDQAGRQIMFKILGWGYDRINELQKTGIRDPLQEFFNAMCISEPQCAISCEKPEEHFKMQKCFPLRQVILMIKRESNVADILLKDEVKYQVLNEIERRKSLPSTYPDAREFQNVQSNDQVSFDLFHRSQSFIRKFIDFFSKKKNILVVDFATEKISGDDQDAEFEMNSFKNLIDNLVLNFHIAVTPTAESSNWEDFVQLQFNECSIVVVVATKDISPTPHYDSLNACELQFHSELEQKLIKLITISTKPVLGICFDTDLRESLENFLVPVFLLPKEMQICLTYIDML